MPLPDLPVAGILQTQHLLFGAAGSYRAETNNDEANHPPPNDREYPVEEGGPLLHFFRPLEEMAEKVRGAFVGAKIPAHGAYLRCHAGSGCRGWLWPFREKSRA